MDRTLEKLTTSLLEIGKKLPELIREVGTLEIQYDKRYFQLLNENSGFGNQAMKEANAKLALMQEPIFEEYHTKKLDLRVLLTQKEIAIEASKNLRGLK